MARTVISRQGLSTQAGQTITFVAVDAANGMEVVNDGRTVILVRTDGAGSVNVSIPSKPDQDGRTGDITAVAVGISTLKSFGPFAPPTIWGDGVGRLWLDFSALVAVAEIAAVEVQGS